MSDGGETETGQEISIIGQAKVEKNIGKAQSDSNN